MGIKQIVPKLRDKGTNPLSRIQTIRLFDPNYIFKYLYRSNQKKLVYAEYDEKSRYFEFVLV